MLLGCIGDDFTGSSDLANVLARQGMRTTLYSGIPETDAAPEVQAGIVALKSRTTPVAEAVAQSLAALEWLRAQGCRQILFKYCSTFDSTPEGNIGPVAEALATALGAKASLACPAYPTLKRSIYQGHLFVGDKLLSESGMQNHPLTPMTDPDLRRWLALQCKGPVGHLPLSVLRQGAEAVAGTLAGMEGLIVADAVEDADLVTLGRAVAGAPLVTGGSGIALGLPANFGISPSTTEEWQGESGHCVVLCGSCSTATRGQIAAHRGPAFKIAPETVMAGGIAAADLVAWAGAQEGLPLIYSSDAPEEVAAAQRHFGREALAGKLDALFAETARQLVASGLRRLVVAGGETSGAVVEGLDLTAMEIGPEIAPGVPALRATGKPLVLALKSGNFGGPGFFAEAAAMLEAG